MFRAQIHFLNLPSSTPYPAVGSWAVYTGIFPKRFVFGWYDQTLGSNYAVIGHPNCVMYPRPGRNRVEVANRRALHTTAYLKEVVIAYPHNILAAVDDNDRFLDDATSADNDGPDECEDGCLRVNDRAGADSNIAFEVHVLADHCFGVDGEFIPYWRHRVLPRT